MDNAGIVLRKHTVDNKLYTKEWRLTSPNENTLETKLVCASWNNCTVNELLKTDAAMIAFDQF